MTREEAKKRLPIIQAYVEGKSLQAMYLKGGYGVKYEDWDNKNPLDFENYDYRVKAEPKYRPYKDADEFGEDLIKKGGYVKQSYNKETSIWAVVLADKDGVILSTENGGSESSYEDLIIDCITWLDGSPCGIKEE